MRPSNFRLWLRSLSPRRYRAVKCGHKTKRTGPMMVFGEQITMQMPINKDGTVDYCLDCLGKMSIHCAWCGEPISIGDPITLYTPRDKEFEVPEEAVIYTQEPLRLVGCLRWDCAHTGADRGGFWLPGEDGQGQVEIVPSIYELAMSGSGGSVVLVNDLGDMDEAIDPTVFPRD